MGGYKLIFNVHGIKLCSLLEFSFSFILCFATVKVRSRQHDYDCLVG